jgi:hypothetical protein
MVVLASAVAYGQEVRMIEGYIEDVRGTRIKVHEQYHEVSTATLTDAANGAPTTRNSLKRGTKVQIFVRDNRPTAVVVFGADILE